MTVEHRAKNRGKKGLEQARWLWLVYQRTGQKLRKYVQIEAKGEDYELLFRIGAFVPPRFALLLFLFFLLLCVYMCVYMCVCIYVCVCVLFWCSLRDIHWSRRIQGRSVNELFESTISVLSRPMVSMIAA